MLHSPTQKRSAAWHSRRYHAGDPAQKVVAVAPCPVSVFMLSFFFFCTADALLVQGALSIITGCHAAQKHTHAHAHGSSGKEATEPRETGAKTPPSAAPMREKSGSGQQRQRSERAVPSGEERAMPPPLPPPPPLRRRRRWFRQRRRDQRQSGRRHRSRVGWGAPGWKEERSGARARECSGGGSSGRPTALG